MLRAEAQDLISRMTSGNMGLRHRSLLSEGFGPLFKVACSLFHLCLKQGSH